MIMPHLLLLFILDHVVKQQAMSVFKEHNKTSLFKPPTRDELQSIKETDQLFGSNLLKLQISELLSEVSLKRHPVEIDELLVSVKDLIKHLPCSDRVKLSDGISLLPDDVKYPLNFTPSSDIKGYFQFYPPKSLNIVGSFLLNTQLNNSPHYIDICVRLPEECLQMKDILNYRYYHKRALYLSLLAGHCKRSPLFQSVCFSAYNPLLPVVLLIPKECSNWTLVLHTSIPEGYFPLHKLYPNRNNVRMTEVVPTPNYNAGLIFEMNRQKRHLEELYEAFEECPNIRDAIILYKIWSKQREFTKKLGCFSSFIFSMLMIYLLRQSKISNEMSSYQLFIVTMKFIVDTDITKNGITIVNRNEYPTLPSIDVYHSHYDVVFVDCIGNLCTHMTKQQYYYMKTEANNSITQSFDSLFLQPVPMIMKYDGIIRIDLSDIKQIKSSSLLSDSDWLVCDCDYKGWPIPFIINKIITIIQNGFIDRLKLIVQDGYSYTQWDIDNERPLNISTQMILGVLFNTDNIYNELTIGPEADKQQAKEFRIFWGDRSELRRFQDSSIHECVQWIPGKDGSIPYQILIHLLTRHANINNDYIVTNIDNTLESIISIDGDQYNMNIMKSYTELRLILCSIKGLPLTISTVKCSSSIVSHSEMPCLRHVKNKKIKGLTKQKESYSAVVDVIIQLESTNKWPLHIDAMNSLITLYYIELYHILLKQYKLQSIPTEQYIDIIKDNHVFHVSIYNPILLELMKKDTISHCDEYEFIHVYKPQLHSYLAGIQGSWPTFGNNARLCKKWISCHLLSGHFADEIIELLLVSLYINPEPFQVSNSPVVMFYRFLRLLMSHDWSHDPLIININDSISDSQAIKKSFTNCRSDYPCMSVITQYDMISSWTRDKPVYPVLHRVIALANATLNFIQENVFNKSINLKQIFQPSLTEYDHVIYLKPNIEQEYSDLISQYFSLLKENYSEYALLFYDKYNNDHRLFVLWKPVTKLHHSFKPQNGYCLIKHKDYYKINIKTIITDMMLLGDGIIHEQTPL